MELLYKTLHGSENTDHEKGDRIDWSKEKAGDLREILGSNLGRVTGYPDIFCDIPRPLQENSRILILRGHDGFLPNSFQLIIRHPTIRRYTVSIPQASSNNQQKMRYREENRIEPAEMKFFHSVKRRVTQDRTPVHETRPELQMGSVP
jgi:hypothetical protein